MDIKTLDFVIWIEGKPKFVFDIIKTLAQNDPNKTVKELWLENKRN